MKMQLFALFLTYSVAFSGELPTAPPERTGFSKDRLNRINVVMQDHVNAGRLAGASGLIARDGKIVFRGAWGDYKPDTIVRMYSMTKGVTGVAAMILYEEGKFSMADPISKYVPEFTNMTVGTERAPAERPILVRDAFRHTTGLDYMGPKDENGEPAYKKIEMLGGAPRVSFNLAEAMKRLATVPLNDQPATKFRYGYSIDLLGRLVEVWSGKTLDQFFEERIFKPLGMKDTAFYVPEEKWPRLATLYAPKREGGIQKSTGTAQDSFKTKPALLLGGAGLCSTIDDYARFYQMLLNGGEVDGVRLLGRKTVELMRVDHLGGLPHVGDTLPAWAGFGLTFAVNPGPGRSPEVGSEGAYWWGGAAGTSFWIDPKERLFGIFLIQILPPNNNAAQQFQRMAYESLVD